MPDKRLKGLDDSVETQVFRALVEVLKADPTLKGVVRRWETLDGSSTKILPPDAREMPYIALMPGPSPMSMVEADRYEIAFTLHVWLATEGLHADDWLNLFGAFRMALSYGNPFRNTTVAEYLHGAGVIIHEVSNPGFAPTSPSPRGDGSTTASDLLGTVRVILRIRVSFS